MREHKIEYIHQILILDGKKNRAPKFLESNVSAIKRVYPDSKYKLWDSKAIRKFLKGNFPNTVLDAYESLTPYAYKADLVKYALLYVYGGLYVDIGVLLLKPWSIPVSKDIAAFKEPAFISPSWSALQNGLLWALPKREEFLLAIENIVNNCSRKYYGVNPLYPTGPVLLGKAFLKVMATRGDSVKADSQYVGQTRCITAEADVINMTYVSREGMVVAIRNKKVAGDLKHIGFSSSNNYNELWHARQVYNENRMEWTSDDPLIGIKGGVKRDKERGIVCCTSKGGETYGPYVSIKEGRYIISIIFEDGSKFSNVRFSLMSDYSMVERKSYVFSDSDLNLSKITFSFSVAEEWNKVEFKVKIPGDFLGGVRGFYLEKIDMIESSKVERKSFLKILSEFVSFMKGRVL